MQGWLDQIGDLPGPLPPPLSAQGPENIAVGGGHGGTAVLEDIAVGGQEDTGVDVDHLDAGQPIALAIVPAVAPKYENRSWAHSKMARETKLKKLVVKKLEAARAEKESTQAK